MCDAATMLGHEGYYMLANNLEHGLHFGSFRVHYIFIFAYRIQFFFHILISPKPGQYQRQNSG